MKKGREGDKISTSAPFFTELFERNLSSRWTDNLRTTVLLAHGIATQTTGNVDVVRWVELELNCGTCVHGESQLSKTINTISLFQLNHTALVLIGVNGGRQHSGSLVTVGVLRSQRHGLKHLACSTRNAANQRTSHSEGVVARLLQEVVVGNIAQTRADCYVVYCQ